METVFIASFVEAALWADTPEDYEGPGLANETKAQLEAIASRFYQANGADILAYPEGLPQAGHDLWFTVAGHGVGYWENKDEVSQRLDKAAREAIPYCEGLYAGDDGLLYCWVEGLTDA